VERNACNRGVGEARRDEDALESAVERAVVEPHGGPHRPRMHRVDAHAGPRETLGELVHAQDLGGLGRAIGPQPDIRPLPPVEIAEVEAGEAVALRVHEDDASLAPPGEAGKEDSSKDEGGHVIDGEDGFESVDREAAAGHVHAGVVDEHVDRALQREQAIGRGANLREHGQIGDDEIEASAGDRLELGDYSPRLLLVPVDHEDVGAERSEAARGRQPDAGARSRHRDELAIHPLFADDGAFLPFSMTNFISGQLYSLRWRHIAFSRTFSS
jgi:hypothetical protein